MKKISENRTSRTSSFSLPLYDRVFFSKVSFKRIEKTELDVIFCKPWTSYLGIKKFQNPEIKKRDFGVFNKKWAAKPSLPQILSAYLVVKTILYQMHYIEYYWKPWKVPKKLQHWE